MNKIKQRKGVFETNSSSSHSVHIDLTMDLMDTSLIPNEKGEIHINCDEYDWDYVRLNSASEKLGYLFTMLTEFERKKLEKIVKDQTGATNIIFNGTGCYVSDPITIDINDEYAMRNLIFNKRSSIYTGNDNGEPPANFFCDEKIGRYKVTLIDTHQYRDLVTQSLLNDDNFNLENIDIINDEDYTWGYAFNNNEESIKESVENYISDHTDYWGYNNKYRISLDFNFKDKELNIIKKYYDNRGEETINLKIIIKRNEY